MSIGYMISAIKIGAFLKVCLCFEYKKIIFGFHINI